MRTCATPATGQLDCDSTAVTCPTDTCVWNNWVGTGQCTGSCDTGTESYNAECRKGEKIFKNDFCNFDLSNVFFHSNKALQLVIA